MKIARVETIPVRVPIMADESIYTLLDALAVARAGATLGIASAAMIHLAMATPGIGADEYPCDILSTFFYEHQLLAEQPLITAGTARPHEQPGLGVELDEAAVARYRVG